MKSSIPRKSLVKYGVTWVFSSKITIKFDLKEISRRPQSVRNPCFLQHNWQSIHLLCRETIQVLLHSLIVINYTKIWQRVMKPYKISINKEKICYHAAKRPTNTDENLIKLHLTFSKCVTSSWDALKTEKSFVDTFLNLFCDMVEIYCNCYSK